MATVTDQTPTPPTTESYDDGTPASPDQIEALRRQLREFSEQIQRDRQRFHDREVARLTTLRDNETDPSVRDEIQRALDQVLAQDPASD